MDVVGRIRKVHFKKNTPRWMSWPIESKDAYLLDGITVTKRLQEKNQSLQGGAILDSTQSCEFVHKTQS